MKHFFIFLLVLVSEISFAGRPQRRMGIPHQTTSSATSPGISAILDHSKEVFSPVGGSGWEEVHPSQLTKLDEFRPVNGKLQVFVRNGRAVLRLTYFDEKTVMTSWDALPEGPNPYIKTFYSVEGKWGTTVFRSPDAFMALLDIELQNPIFLQEF